jgi:hypothetical protein
MRDDKARQIAQIGSAKERQRETAHPRNGAWQLDKPVRPAKGLPGSARKTAERMVARHDARRIHKTEFRQGVDRPDGGWNQREERRSEASHRTAAGLFELILRGSGLVVEAAIFLFVESPVFIAMAGDFVAARGDLTDESRRSNTGSSDREKGALAAALVQQIENPIDNRDEPAALVVVAEMVLEIEREEDLRT